MLAYSGLCPNSKGQRTFPNVALFHLPWAAKCSFIQFVLQITFLDRVSMCIFPEIRLVFVWIISALCCRNYRVRDRLLGRIRSALDIIDSRGLMRHSQS